MKEKILSIIILSLLIVILLAPSLNASINYEEKTSLNENKPFTNNDLFDRQIELLMRFSHKPSISAGIIKDETLLWTKGYGFYNIEKNKQAQPETIYLSASISKTVTATALMQLWEQGLFDLDEDVNNYLPFSLRNPNFPNDPITFKMLLSHRSSLSGDNEFWICLSYVPGDPDIPDYPYPWLKEYLTTDGNAYSSIVWSNNPPGESYAYSNIGFSIIGYLIEIISGEKFDQYCKKYVFEPLEMYNTSFRLRDINISNLAVPYEYEKRNYIPHPHYNMLVLYPAGSMRTSVEDLSHFLIAHMNGGEWNNVSILESSTVDIMHRDHYTLNDEKYGLGWMIGKDIFGKKEIGHSGAWPGVHTMMRYRPEDKTAIIVLTNSMSPTFDSTIIETFSFKMIINSFFTKAKMLQ